MILLQQFVLLMWENEEKTFISSNFAGIGNDCECDIKSSQTFLAFVSKFSFFSGLFVKQTLEIQVVKLETKSKGMLQNV